MALSAINTFDQFLAALERQWGSNILVPLSAWPEPYFQTISTSFGVLDNLLGAGGIPRNHLTTLMGSGTSGITSLAYNLVAQAQQQELIGVYIDPPQTFDPQSARLCGIDLDLLMLIRPVDWTASLSLLRDVMDVEVAALAVFDAAGPGELGKEALAGLELTLNRVTSLLPHSTWTLVLLLPERLPFLPDHFAALRLRCTCQEVIDGYPPDLQIEAYLLKDKFGPAGRRANFAIHHGKGRM